MSAAITILVNILGLVSPLVLIVFGLKDWKQNRWGSGMRVQLPIALGIMLVADWVLFLRFVIQSVTPYGMYFRTTWATAALLLLSFLMVIGSLAAPTGRWQLTLAGFVILSLWVCVGYAPAHYLSRIDFATVAVDDHPVAASVYLGHPTDMEAEAFALVRLERGAGNYLLDFDSERMRPAKVSEYVRIPGGVWYLRSVQSGAFTAPLPPRHLNQFRIPSRDGRIITVQF